MQSILENKEYDEFQQKLDIPLFNTFLSLAVNTSDDENAMAKYNKIMDELIWGEKHIDYETYFSSYELKYVGEVLERYEEKIGTDIRYLRAIALALGYASSFLTKSMFIGWQKENFIRKIRGLSEEDVYLRAAEYLLARGTAKGDKILQELSCRRYYRTEEVVFILSLFDDDKGFHIMQPQLVTLFDKERTMPVVGNISIISWLLKKHTNQIKGCRMKNNVVLRAWCKLPTLFAKKEQPVYRTLKAAGYNDVEITYAKCRLVYESGIQDRLNPKSIPGEKTATEFCVTYLNSTDIYNKSLNNYVTWLLDYYDKFTIRYQGFLNLWESIKDRLNPTQVQTTLWMLKNVKETFPYRFNVFEDKWKVLAEELSESRYRDLFTEQLLACQVKSKEMVLQYLKRFTEITGREYIDIFYDYFDNGREAFALLVESEIIVLWDFFKLHIKEHGEKGQELYYLHRYVENMSTYYSYVFWDEFFEKYSQKDIEKFFGVNTSFYSPFCDFEYHYYGHEKKLDIKREFLSLEEEQKFFLWIEDSVYYKKPSSYILFAEFILKNDLILELVGKDCLRPLLDKMLSYDCIDGGVQDLKEKIYSKEEWEQEKLRIHKEIEEKKRQKKIETLQNEKAELEKKYDGTVDTLLEYIDTHCMSVELRLATQLAAGKVGESLESHLTKMTKETVVQFLKLFSKLVQYDGLSLNEVKDYIMKMEVTETYVAENV